MTAWQPIETAPKGKELILYWPKVSNGKNSVLYPMIRVDRIGMTPFREPTHWMPLPEPPK
jgi:hypothetical protein